MPTTQSRLPLIRCVASCSCTFPKRIEFSLLGKVVEPRNWWPPRLFVKVLVRFFIWVLFVTMAPSMITTGSSLMDIVVIVSIGVPQSLEKYILCVAEDSVACSLLQ